MPRLKSLNINKVVSPDAASRLEPDEQEAIMEMAYYAIAADMQLKDSEIEAFSDALVALYGSHATPQNVQSLVNQLVQSSEQSQGPGCFEVDEARMRTLAQRLRSQFARDLAYRLAYAMAMADFDTNDCEFHYDQKLREILGLSEQAAEVLADEVIDAVGVAAPDLRR